MSENTMHYCKLNDDVQVAVRHNKDGVVITISSDGLSASIHCAEPSGAIELSRLLYEAGCGTYAIQAERMEHERKRQQGEA